MSRLLAQIGHIRYPLLAGVCLLVVLAVLNVRVSAPPPAGTALVRVRWTPSVSPVEQASHESALRLRRGAPHGDRTWSYDLLDSSSANIRAVVTDPAVEDTDGIDRQLFRLNLPQVTIAERLTTAFPGLERTAGPGLGRWLSPENAWPALLAFAWLMAIVRPCARTLVFRGIPSLSPTGLGLFRVALGLWLLVSVPGVLSMPDTALPIELHRAADGFADWTWVHWLALHPAVNSIVLMIALVALTFFTAGVAPRATYKIALAALTVRVFVVLQYRSAHDIGLPLVVLWGLALVPWDAGLTLVPRQSRRAVTDSALGYAIWWPGAALGLALLAAAYAKLDTSGIGWVLGGAAKYHFVEDFQRAPTTWGLWIATQPGWSVAASCGAVAIEALVVIHLFFRQWLARAAAGLAVLALLAGLYLLQGHFWPLWWGMLLAFVPWDLLGNLVKSQIPNPKPQAATVHSAIPRYAVVFVTALVCVQFFASARRVEVEPFVSDYGMYSWTWPSTAAFDRQISRKYRVYHYLVTSNGETLDITDRLRALPKATDTLADAVDRLREGNGLASSDREALRTVGAMYQSAFSVPISELTVFRDEQAFDWQRGRFYQSANHEPTGTIDLLNGEFNDRGHQWRQ